MPGIVGLFTRQPRAQAEHQLTRMLATMKHEPFYETGTWIEPALGAYIGWVLRSKPCGRPMPMQSSRDDVRLVLSGENVLTPDAETTLKRRGYPAADDETAPLVELYEGNRRFAAALNGRVQGVLLDGKRGTTVLFNDRFGLHRLYYHEADDAFYFAAEAKAILAVRPELRSIDARSLAEYVTCGCVLENRSLFRGVHVVPPGSAWEFRDGALECRDHYFEPREWEEQGELGLEEYYEGLRAIFERNLPRYLATRERIGMSLTGGLDTRMIMAWQRLAPGDLPCYSFGGIINECHDVRVARRVAAACRQPYEVIEVGQRLFADFPNLAESTIYRTDGCAHVNRAADLYANECARHIAPVRMTGNYGGEILRGIRAFKPGPLSNVFSPELQSHANAAAATYAGIVACHPVSFSAFRQAPWHHYGLLALEETKLAMRTPYLDSDLVRLVFRAPALTYASNDVSIRLIGDGSPAMKMIMTDRGLAGPHGPLASAVRRQWLEFTFKAEYAYDYGMPQWLSTIDRALSPLKPERLFLGRHKFCHYRVWYRDQLAGYVRDILLDPRSLSRPYLQRSALSQSVERHVAGSHNHTVDIHMTLTLELIHRAFVDR